MTGCTRLTGLALVVALAGCTAGGTGPTPPAPGSGSSSPAATASPVTATTPAPTAMPEPQASPPSSTPMATPGPIPTSKPQPTGTPAPTSTASTAPPPVTFKPGDTAVVVAGAVRVRNDHSLEASGFTPMLPKGSSLLIMEGPKHGSGYHWYRVEPINVAVTGVQGMDLEPQDVWGMSMWVPVASRDGEAWLRHGRPRCPAKPATALELYATPRGARITCFSGVPITIPAQVVANEVACEYDPGMAIRPRWFAGARVTVADGSVGEALLATPRGRVPAPPCPPFDILLYVDPAGTHPAALRAGDRLTVTGEFDHPDAAECTWKWGEDPWKPTDACRYWFVATKVVRSR